MIDKELLNKYYLSQVEENNNIEMTGWRVIGSIKFESVLYLPEPVITLKTSGEAWICEFYISLISMNNNKLLVLVSPECHESYFLVPEEILDKVKDIISNYAIDDLCLKKMIEDSYRRTSWEEKNSEYRGANWIYNPKNSNIWCNDSSITTCTSGYVNTITAVDDITSTSASTISPGSLVYDKSGNLFYRIDNDNNFIQLANSII